MSIEKYLVLNKYMLSLLGVEDFKDIQNVFKNATLGIDLNSGKTHFCELLESAFQGIKLSSDDLDRYDGNIQSYLKCINEKRQVKITLKYFQYLSILFTEIYLDMLKNNKAQFLSDLNEFLENYKKENSIDLINHFTEDDLNKIAFWMATGSGKTLISHINYYQFLQYDLFQPDSIIFVTPNEGLSKQHFEEMQKSGIPAKLYSGSLDAITPKKGEVLILEITKLVEEKKGGGKTIPVDAFKGRNLVFVDEGHKGKKSEEQKWSKLRDKISENGFTFEYSATFGQVLSEQNADTLAKYGKSIIMDYSYKYFYIDQYGKDFETFNVKNAQKISENKYKETVFVANLLSYYEQLLVYKENKDIVSEYNIEKPLWIFVGSTVTSSKQSREEEKTVSDILDIILFLKKVLEDKEWLENQIQNILKSKTVFEGKEEENSDIFSRKFQYLRKRQISIDDLYEEVFGRKGKLRVYEIVNASGEFGLKVGEENYFGVVNIGDVSEFKKKLEQNGIEVLQDVISQSLFDKIKDVSSTTNILIGAKKFIEGWDTWRVSTMGLLNIGTSEGPQIIQLFGRGIRLKGKDMSLQRSYEVTGNKLLKILETLQIYGIKANYIDQFLEAINKEIDLETLEIPVEFRHQNKWNALLIPEKGKSDFKERTILKLVSKQGVEAELNLIPKTVAHFGADRNGEAPVKTITTMPKISKFTFDGYTDMFDWDRIFLEVNNYRLDRGYFNLVITKEGLRNILCTNCHINSTTNPFEIKTADDVNRVEDQAIILLKSYLYKFYRIAQQKADTEATSYKTLGQKEQQLKLPFAKEDKEVYTYTLKFEKDSGDETLKESIKNLLQNINQTGQTKLNIYFDRHLFLPLLIKNKDIKKIIPDVALNESEKKFLEGVKHYYELHKDKFENIELFVLRNTPKSGVGFFLESANFYPDFILWLKLGNTSKQMIVFVEPHGLIYSGNFNSDEKINFRETLKNIEENINAREKRDDVLLDYFLITPTSYEDLTKNDLTAPSQSEFEGKHVFFFNDTQQWVDKMFNEIFDELNKHGGEKQ